MRKFKRSVGNAFGGVKYAFRNERNFRYQLLATAIVIFLMYWFDVTRAEQIALWIVICAVLILELLNTAIEAFADLVKPRLHEQVGIIKDIMASTVLIASIGALVVGLLIFWPYFL